MSSLPGLDKLTAKKLLRVLLGLIILIMFLPSAGFTQFSEELKGLRKEMESLKQGQITIRKELQAIKSLLRRIQAPLPRQTGAAILSVDNSPFKGNKNAELTLTSSLITSVPSVPVTTARLCPSWRGITSKQARLSTSSAIFL